MMKARKSCWTCTARKIQCDGIMPTCMNCSKTRRLCKGYQMRLSWPKPRDTKRATVGPTVPFSLGASPSRLLYIHTTGNDVDLHVKLSSQLRVHPVITISRCSWRQCGLRASYADLIDYFYNAAHQSLGAFGVTTIQVRDALLSLASIGDTPSTLALQFAIFAFSALHWSGMHDQAMQLKISALQCLSTSIREGPLNSETVSQHVATSMLLGGFEILLASESSGEWVLHIWGAMDMICSNHILDQPYESYTAPLIDWVYYHNALSRFTMNHWRNKPVNTDMPDTLVAGPAISRCSSPTRYKPLPPSPNPTFAILNLLTEVCDTLLDPWDPRSRDETYQSRLEALEARSKKISVQADLTKSVTDFSIAVDLYQVATRIYLARASQSSCEKREELDTLIDKAFKGPVTSCICEHFFPLLIIACEARLDEQRVAVLNLIDRMQRDNRIRSVNFVKRVIQSIWIQQDLNTDSELLGNYARIMSAAISSSSTIHSFV